MIARPFALCFKAVWHVGSRPPSVSHQILVKMTRGPVQITPNLQKCMKQLVLGMLSGLVQGIQYGATSSSESSHPRQAA